MGLSTLGIGKSNLDIWLKLGYITRNRSNAIDNTSWLLKK